MCRWSGSSRTWPATSVRTAASRATRSVPAEPKRRRARLARSSSAASRWRWRSASPATRASPRPVATAPRDSLSPRLPRGSASGSTGSEGRLLTRFALSRRGLLAGAAAGGGLLVAWALLPRSHDVPLSPGRGEAAFNAWLKIGSDGVVTVAVPQLEMGQGVTTLLPQIVAIELGADWRQVAVEPAPASGAYVNLPLAARWAPLWRPTIAALADEPHDWLLRRWAVDWEECDAQGGFVVHGEQRLSFARLAEEAARYSPPDPPPLRPEPPADRLPPFVA